MESVRQNTSLNRHRLDRSAVGPHPFPAPVLRSFPVLPSALMPPVRPAPDAAERLDGIRRDLANAVAWGTVTEEQAAGFYARLQARIAHGH